MDVIENVPALEKLLDYVASGIGSVAGPMFAPWRARREAKAGLVVAEGEAERRQILAEGQSSAIQIAINAQATAREKLGSPETAVRGELTVDDAVAQRIRFQEEKRQRNITAVAGKAALELGDRDVPDSETDHDGLTASSAKPRMCLRKRCSRFGRRCSPARSNGLEARPSGLWASSES